MKRHVLIIISNSSEMDLKLDTLRARIISIFCSPENCQCNFSLSRNLYPLCIHNPVRKE